MTTTPEAEAPPPRPATRSIKERVVAGASWTVVGYGSQNVLRLASNLILTRILAPSAFGLMMLTNIFITGLELLSDVGVGPAIIHSPRGDDRDLLDTAWTLQIIRGGILFAVSILIAWPASKYYKEPQLASLVAVAGLGLVIRSFTPTRVHTMNRKLLLGRVTMLDLICQTFALCVTALASYVLRSAWGLLVGTLAGDLARVSLNFLFLPGHRHRLLLDRSALRELVHMGRWIFVSTAITYAAGNLDRLVMGRVLSVNEMGIYSVAFQMVSSVTGLGRVFGSRVVFPMLAETARSSRELLYRRLRKVRLLWILPTSAILVGLSIWGDVLIGILYKPNYHAAGWMLRILAAGSVVGILNQASGIIWPSLGEFRTITTLMFIQVPLLLTGLYFGGTYFGTVGYVVGIAVIELAMFPINSFLAWRRYRLFQPEVDMPVMAVAAALIALGAYLR